MSSRRTFLRGVGVSAAVLGGVVGTTAARPSAKHALFALDFGDPADADVAGAASPGWVVDRQATASWETATFDGDDRLQVVTDGDAPTSGFYAYQGMQYRPSTDGAWDAGHNSTLSYRFYVDPAWEADDDGHQTGMWGVVGNADGDVVAYPILEYQDSTAAGGAPNFRLWEASGWRDLGVPRQTRLDPAAGGWVDVQARLLFDGADPHVVWSLNDARVAADHTIDEYGTPATFLAPILNTRNVGVDQTYYYDDVRLAEAGRGGD